MKLVFLDRDGVINRFPGNGNYVTKLKNFHFIPGSLDAIRDLTKDGYTLFVVSNQAGVGKGIFTQAKLDHITRNMLRDVKNAGGRIKKVYYSTSRSDEGCEFRKPNIGSIKAAMAKLNKSIRSARHAYFIGDTESDIQAGKNAGCKTIFVLSGREDIKYLRKKWKVRPDFVAKNLKEAAQIIRNINDDVICERALKRETKILIMGSNGTLRRAKRKTSTKKKK